MEKVHLKLFTNCHVSWEESCSDFDNYLINRNLNEILNVSGNIDSHNLENFVIFVLRIMHV